jgi:hypothetical protein
MPMLRLLHAGLVAAGRQLVAILIITALASWATSHDFISFRAPAAPPGAEVLRDSTSSFLILAYLLTAVGLAFTGGQAVEVTAARIRYASSLMNVKNRQHMLTALIVQLVLSAIIFAIFALEPPPEFLTKAASYFEYDRAASIIWGATMSIGVAVSGATGHAALRALG